MEPDAAGTPWLEAAPLHQRPWGIGCRWCREHYKNAAVKSNSAWCRAGVSGKAWQQACNIRFHQNTARHKRAAAAWRGLHAAAIAAPAASDFDSILRALQNGKLPENSRKRKATAMGWCLFEAVRDEERQFLRNSSVISVMQDARGDRVLTRYAACSRDERTLEVRRGILSMADPGTGALALVEAVKRGIDSFATKRARHRNMPPPRTAPRLDGQLVQRVRRRVEIFTADGAADEQLAGRLLAATQREDGTKLFPRLRHIMRDKPHASRRLLQRTWCQDGFLRELQDRWLFGQHSVAKLLQHSRVLQQNFREHQAADDLPVLRNMGFAKHRFDSVATPLAKIVLRLDAVLAVLVDVIRTRRAEPYYRPLVELMDMLSEEMLVQLAMMADCSDEVLVLTRFLDKENYEAAELPRHLLEFSQRTERLFVHGACLEAPGTFTSHVLQLLRRPRLVVLGNGLPKSLGSRAGPCAAAIRRCLARMVNWRKLAAEVLRTEFPGHEILQCFAEFDLGGGSDESTCAAEPERDPNANVCGLAAAFRVCHDTLDAELRQMRRVASYVHARVKAGGVNGSLEAWREALRRTQQNSKRRRLYGTRALLPTLRRYSVFVASTSGVEQSFCVADRLAKQQGLVSEEASLRNLVLATAPRDDNTRARIVQAARVIWGQEFGAPRQRPAVDPVPQRRASRPGSEAAPLSLAGMLRARRRAATRAKPLPPSVAQTAAAAQAQAGRLWSERQARELARQQALQQDRWLDAVLDGVAAAGRRGQPDGAALAARELATRKRRDAYLRQQERAARLKASRPEELPPGSRIWFAPGLWEESMRATLLEHAWQRVEDLAVAAAMVVHDPGAPPKRVAFVAGMTGAAVISATYLSNPRQGCRLQYHRALGASRALWISGGCRERFPEEVALIERLVRLAAGRTRWRLSASVELHTRTGLSASARRERLALVLRSELEDPVLRPVLGKMTMADFVKKYSRVDTSCLQLGACGR